mgnify:CR=1 FL=1
MSRQDDIAKIVTAAHTLTRVAAARTDNDAPAAQWRALAVLESEGPLRLGELAVAARTTQPGMTRLVTTMEEHGLVTRERDQGDYRVTILRVTDAGSAALAAWRVELGEALEPFFADLGEEDWAALSHAADILTSRTISQGAAR